MKTINVREAKPLQIDWLVAKTRKEPVHIVDGVVRYKPGQFSQEERYYPSSDANQGHFILEDNNVNVIKVTRGPSYNEWAAVIDSGQQAQTHSEFNDGNRFYYFDDNDELVRGDSMLIAGLRCYLVNTLGDTAEVPDELA